MLIDAFLFCPLPEEVPKFLDILEKRVKELDSIVDFFIIAEKSPFCFRTNRERFIPFLKKIVHVGVFKDKAISHARDYLLAGIYHLRIKPEDTVILSEFNSIPALEKLKESVDNIQDYLLLQTEGKNFTTQESNNVKDNILLLKGFDGSKRQNSIIETTKGLNINSINSKMVKNAGFTYV